LEINALGHGINVNMTLAEVPYLTMYDGQASFKGKYLSGIELPTAQIANADPLLFRDRMFSVPSNLKYIGRKDG
jgi:hypothetical protein